MKHMPGSGAYCAHLLCRCHRFKLWITVSAECQQILLTCWPQMKQLDMLVLRQQFCDELDSCERRFP